jgi:hypothetical protein
VVGGTVNSEELLPATHDTSLADGGTAAIRHQPRRRYSGFGQDSLEVFGVLVVSDK